MPHHTCIDRHNPSESVRYGHQSDDLQLHGVYLLAIYLLLNDN